MTLSRSLPLFLLVFTVSGFAGLVYESVWTQYLKLFLGHAAYAQVLVLTIFMGGLALGAWLTSLVGGRWRHLLMAYAAVEAIVGLMALSFHGLFTVAMAAAYDSVIPWLGSPGLIATFKWSLGAALILPPAVLLGATFPLMSAGLIRHAPRTAGYALAMLYFANSLGAALGVLVSGFVLIDALGLPGTIRAAGLLNIAVALIVVVAARSLGAPALDRSSSSPRPGGGAFGRMFLVAAFITGCASFLYEVGWIRMLSLVLGSSSHAFELMLGAFIFGLALGGLLIRRRVDTTRSPLTLLGAVQIAMGCCALLTLPLYDVTFDVMAFAINNLAPTDGGYRLYSIFSNLIALLVMLPATVLAGMTLPLMTHHLLRRGAGERAIGQVYASNTVGAIAGIALGLGVLMPTLGLESLIIVGGIGDAALGILLVVMARRAGEWQWRPGRDSILAAVVSLCLVYPAVFVDFDPLRMASGVYLDGEIERDREIVYHVDGRTSTINVIRTPGHLAITTNGKIDAGLPDAGVSKDVPTMTLIAALPLAMQPRARTVAVIGMGSGMTSHTVLGSPHVERVDTIEIEPAMVGGARLFGDRVSRVFDDPRSHIHIEDAKAFFSQHQRRYDLIMSEPSNPWVSGVAGLFSNEFYAHTARHLSDGGLFVQWLHIYHMNVELLASVVKALAEQFDDYAIYAMNDTDLVIVAVKAGRVPEPTETVFDLPALERDLAAIGIVGIQDFTHRRIGTRQALQPYFDTFPIRANSDYFPVLDRGAERARFLRQNVLELHRFRLLDVPLLEVLEGRSPREVPTRLGRNLFLHTAQSARQAMALRDALARHDEETVAMTSATVRLLGELRALDQQCLFPGSDQAILAVLHRTAELVLPWLNPMELEIVWQNVRHSPCSKNLSQRTERWLRLYEALGQRRFDEARRLAEMLLPDGPIAANRGNDYLLTVALLGALADDDDAGARRLWRRYQRPGTDVVEIRALRAHLGLPES